MINYILQIVLFQFLFIVIYDVFLRNETFFNWNRAYLLLTSILSFFLPFIKINAFENASQINFVEHLPTVILNPQESIKAVGAASFSSYALIILILGSLFMLGLFIYKISVLLLLKHRSNIKKYPSHTLVLIDKKGVVFSFFKFIYIDKLFINQPYKHIISHELVHIKQRHSVDLIFFEILKIITWFNPAIYIFQNRITELHEFIADAKTIEPENKSAFFNRLLTTTFKVTKVDFINQFYKHSLIKKRIMMTNKNKSKQVLKLKYLLLVPALGSMLFYVSCQQKDKSFSEQVKALDKTISAKDSLTKSERKAVMDLTKTFFDKTFKISDKTVIEREYLDNVPFAAIEHAPIYPGCEDAQDQKGCFSGKLNTLIAQNFNLELANSLGLSAKPKHKRIFVMFTISKTGKVTDIRARAPHKKLEEEAIRVIKLMPKVIPGKQKGKTVSVKYSLPIVFNVQK